MTIWGLSDPKADWRLVAKEIAIQNDLRVIPAIDTSLIRESLQIMIKVVPSRGHFSIECIEILTNHS